MNLKKLWILSLTFLAILRLQYKLFEREIISKLYAKVHPFPIVYFLLGRKLLYLWKISGWKSIWRIKWLSFCNYYWIYSPYWIALEDFIGIFKMVLNVWIVVIDQDWRWLLMRYLFYSFIYVHHRVASLVIKAGNYLCKLFQVPLRILPILFIDLLQKLDFFLQALLPRFIFIIKIW